MTLEELLAAGAVEEVEDGEQSQFSMNLETYFELWSEQALVNLEKYLADNTVKPHLLCDLLIEVGRTNLDSKLLGKFLVSYLQYPIPLVRYGAVVALEYRKQSEYIPELEAAYVVEKDRVLKGVIRQILEYLGKLS